MTVNNPLHESRAVRGNYVMLTADTLTLLLPQHEVGSIEYLENELECGQAQGIFRLPGEQSGRWYAALSAQMTLLPVCPADRFVVTSLENQNLGWCWSALRVLIDVELMFLPLPAVLISPDTPVSQYVEFEGKFSYLCSARQLYDFALASGVEG